ncbi:MAG: Uncharacterised protein [Pseudidiomarina mangrovi]|nr:MAG: Uncharacterised protein [Pseudidiomarina mangrovi]
MQPELRHNKHRNTLHPNRRTLNTRQHQMHNVLGEILIAPRYIHFLAFNAVVAITVFDGFGGEITERRADVRFGQCHGAGKAAIQHSGKIQLLLRGRAESADHVGGSTGQKWVGRAGGVGRHKVGIASHMNQRRQLHTAMFIVLPCGK